MKKQRHQEETVRKAHSQKSRRAANEGSKLDIGLVDLFAGLRAVHVAAEGTRANFVPPYAAEKCPFTNKIAVKITLQRWYTPTSACWMINGQAPSPQK